MNASTQHPRRAPRRAPRPYSLVQPLESRRMFAATPFVVEGTDAGERIAVVVEQNHVVAYRNGIETQSRPASNVSSVEVRALNGNDRVVIGKGLGSRSVLADGGGGNDTIFGSNAKLETFHGGLGNDYLSGGHGNDRLYGGNQDDTLVGGRGNDLMHGGGGNDFLDGRDPGSDSLHGNAGDDTLWANDGDGDDEIYGGSGFDRAKRDEINWGSDDYVAGDVEYRQDF